MAKTWFFSDPHFGDENIFNTTQRHLRFDSVNYHDEAIVDLWNSTVKSDDTVYLLGDLGDIQSKPNYVKDNLLKLNGHIILILGNHDKESFNSTDELKTYLDDCNITEYYDKPILIDDFWLLSHEPVFVNQFSPFANIFGHVHDNHIYRTVSDHAFCVCEERIGLKPIDFDKIKSEIKAYNNALRKDDVTTLGYNDRKEYYL